MAALSEFEIDLDYQIEFPSEEDKKNGAIHDIKNIWPIVESDTKENKLVVVLFGWTGSNQKYLAKYSDIYLKRGCIVLRCIVPVKTLFFQTQNLSTLSNRFVRLFKKLELESHPVFFHVFSNGGSFMYSYVLRELSAVQNSMRINLRGTIFDSAPCPRTIGNGIKAVNNVFSNLNQFRYVVGFFVMLGVIAEVFWSYGKEAFQQCVYGERLPLRFLDTDSIQFSTDKFPLRNWLGRLCKMKNHNYLFLYSDTDELIPWKQVEEVADITASYANKVEKKKFMGSEHVQHYRMYPEEYVQTVTEFIRRAMMNKMEDTVFWEDY